MAHPTGSQWMNLADERDPHNLQPEDPHPRRTAGPREKETSKNLENTTTPPTTGITSHSEPIQQARPNEDVKMDSPPDDIQPPTKDNQPGGEGPLDSSQKFGFESYENILRSPRMPFELGTEHVSILSSAIYSYAQLMENRLAALEDGSRRRQFGDGEPALREASNADSGLYTDTGLKDLDPQEEKAPKTITTVNRVAWPAFRRKYEGETDVDRDHAIDVLVGEALIPHKAWRNSAMLGVSEHLIDQKRRLRAYDAWISIALQGVPPSNHPQQDQTDANSQKESPPSEKPVEISENTYQSVPERIRINGDPLKQLLEKALGVDFKSPGTPVVLLRPFKLLTLHNDRIWKLYKRLKQKFAKPEREVPERDQAEDEGGNLLEKYGTEQAYKELQCLIEFMEKDLKVLKSLEDASIQKIAFSELWHIFQPGVVVINRPGKSLRTRTVGGYRVFHVTGGRSYLSPPEDNDGDFTNPYRTPEKSSDLVVSCYQVDFDGYKFGPMVQSFSIQKFDGLEEITALTIYPIRFAGNESQVRKSLLHNGDMFLDVCGGKHVFYRGPNLHPTDHTEEIDSEVIVDTQAALWDKKDKDKEDWTYYAFDFGLPRPAAANKAEVGMISSGGCRVANCCENDLIFNDLYLDHQCTEDFLADRSWLTMDIRYLDDDRNRIPHEDLILMQSLLFAFVLKDRKWVVIDINRITRVPEPTNEAWKSLVLPPGHKSMVYSLVQSHFRDRKSSSGDNGTQADLVQGKGKGLIILLHGAPGVGKTSTAECVAEICRRPLYPITCGELGITAVDVETKLKRIFLQAQKWKCVLLLDEADVFLSERGSNVKHNSLVSVFLRVLEYYHGILFLTTNRVGRMDEAFRSRVHISLYYPPLDRESTIKIFKSNLDRTAQRQKGMMKIRERDILEFAKDHYDFNKQRVRWNGRQIRNAFHIAAALAENEAVEQDAAVDAKTTNDEGRAPRKPRLRARHFQVVEGASSKFDEYLTSVLGMAQSERIRQEAYRKDDWELADDHQGQGHKERVRRRRHRKVYSGDETDSEEDESDASLGQSKRFDEGRDSDSDSQSERPRRRKTQGFGDSDASEDQPTTRESKNAAEKQRWRDKDQKTHRSRNKGKERERGRD